MSKRDSLIVDETRDDAAPRAHGTRVRVAVFTWGLAATLALAVFGLAVLAERMGIDEESSASRAPFGEHECAVWALAYSPDGRTLASAGMEGTIRVWDVPSGGSRGEIRHKPGGARTLAYSPNGRALAVGGLTDQILLYDTESGAETARFDVSERGSLSLVFSPDGRALASVGAFDGSVTVWDLATRRPRVGLEHAERGFRRLAFSPDGRALAAAGNSGSVTLWDVATGRRRLQFQPHQHVVIALAFSPDGRTLATGAELEAEVKLFDPANGAEQATLVGSKVDPVGVTGLAFDPGGGLLADARGDGNITLWDIRTGQVGATLRGHNGWVWSAAFSPDGRALATGGTDRTIRVWDVVQALHSGRG